MNITGELIELIGKNIDWDEVILIDEKFFTRPWNKCDWLGLDLTRYHLLVFKNSQKIMAFALFDIISGDDTAHLLKILVLPEFQGSGVSSTFWLQMMGWLRGQRIQKIYLEVEELNLRARKFYEKCGFLEMRRVVGFYSDGANALTMQLVLDP